MSQLPELGPEAQTLFDSAACGLMLTTPDGTFLRVNHMFCSWVNMTAEQLVGKRKLQELLSVGGRIFHQTHWAPLLAMQGSVSEVKLELMQQGGGALPIVLNAIVRQQYGMKVHELAAYVARDRDKYEQELVSSRKRLQELVAETSRLHEHAHDRALFAEQMIGIVSHDLRNPISTIQTGAALLSRGADVPGHDRLVARISRAGQRADRLISDLLDFTAARLGSGLRLAPEPVALHELVAEAVEELRLAYPGRVLRHERSESAGECRTDSARLEQLLGNLVSNAMTYGQADAAVTVTSWVDEASFGISVHNLGAPIPEAAIPTLFQPMTRGLKSLGSKRSVGLGLFIVSEIVRAHGGSTRVESSAEQGTTFKATFPRR